MKPAELIIIGLCGQSVFLNVPHFHEPEETLHANAFFREPGGKGYNQAVAAMRLGASVAFAAAIGDDADGRECEARMKAAGAAQTTFFIKPEASTAYAAILTNERGENRVTVYPGASQLLSGEDVSALRPLFREARYCLLTAEIPESAFERAVELAEQNHVRIVLNPAPWKEWLRPYLHRAWCLTPNQNETRAMLRGAELSALKELGLPRVLVTLGAKGALCVENGQEIVLLTPAVQAIDTTGAGDALNGALCAALLENQNFVAAARYGVAAAALSVTRPHVLDALPTRKEISERCGLQPA